MPTHTLASVAGGPLRIAAGRLTSSARGVAILGYALGRHRDWPLLLSLLVVFWYVRSPLELFFYLPCSFFSAMRLCSLLLWHLVYSSTSCHFGGSTSDSSYRWWLWRVGLLVCFVARLLSLLVVLTSSTLCFPLPFLRPCAARGAAPSHLHSAFPASARAYAIQVEPRIQGPASV